MVKYKIQEKNPIIALTGNEIDVLIHNVTCQGVLAVGVAKQIGITFPFVDTVNWKACREKAKNKRALLGMFSKAMTVANNRKYGVVNLYGQIEPGPFFDKIKAKEALKKALQDIGYQKKSGNPIRYGITLIGTEFNQLNESESCQLINDALEELYFNTDIDYDVTIFKYET